ncbi:MAG: hypothetical protein JW795_04795, partial [Chitinivibrionales bacterium]|nr:hypothetical protein [Chitinivibrionales bacterium]
MKSKKEANPFNPADNFEKTKRLIKYVPRSAAKPPVYASLGFMCGLEVHQQLKTEKKLFCHCPAGCYQDFNLYDAEVVRHM